MDNDDKVQENEIFSLEKQNNFGLGGILNVQWWKKNFFVVGQEDRSDEESDLDLGSDDTAKTKRVKREGFGTWDGVYTSCMINIFGVVIFLRMGWMVGYAGIGFSAIIVLIGCLVSFLAFISAISLCGGSSYRARFGSMDRGGNGGGGSGGSGRGGSGGGSGYYDSSPFKVKRGGVYSLITTSIGAKIGAPIGVVYCFGQAAACALYVVGFGESIAVLLHQDNEWISRAIGAVLLIFLIGTNMAGVKWVVRLQLLLLLFIVLAVLDFLIGSFTHVSLRHGFVGYNLETLLNNIKPSLGFEQLTESALGSLLPDGMSGYNSTESSNEADDLLKNALVKGGQDSSITTTTSTLSEANEVAIFFRVLGVFFPTATGVFAGINMAADLKNPEKSVPVGTLAALASSTSLYLIFLLVLGSTCQRYNLQTDYMIAEKVSATGFIFLSGLYISSISSGMGSLYGSPRILECIAEDGAMPCLAFLVRKEKKEKKNNSNHTPVLSLLVISAVSLLFVGLGDINFLGPIVAIPFILTYAVVNWANFSLGTSRMRRDLTDNNGGGGGMMDHQYGYATFGWEGVGSGGDGKEEKKAVDGDGNGSGSGGDRVVGERGYGRLMTSDSGSGEREPIKEYSRKPFYVFFYSRWLSLFGFFTSLAAMFCIQWIYSLVTLLVCFALYLYILKANPTTIPGLSELSFHKLISNIGNRFKRSKYADKERMIIADSLTDVIPSTKTSAEVLTETNDDYAARDPFHKSQAYESTLAH